MTRDTSSRQPEAHSLLQMNEEPLPAGAESIDLSTASDFFKHLCSDVSRELSRIFEAEVTLQQSVSESKMLRQTLLKSFIEWVADPVWDMLPPDLGNINPDEPCEVPSQYRATATVWRKIEEWLRSQGALFMECTGTQYDPEKQRAINRVSGRAAVVECVVKPGFIMQDTRQVLREAHVRLADPEKTKPESSED